MNNVTQAQNAGLYLHIPFCLSKCRYCNFYSVPYDRALADAYVDALVRDIEQTQGWDMPFDSIYFGGGTPSLLAPAQFERVFAALRRRFTLHNPEITLEANPDTMAAERLAAFRSLGVGRLSLGVQSMCDRALATAGRRHDADTARRAVEAAQAAGFSELSVDLMLGLPHDSPDAVEAFADFVREYEIPHVSAYILKVEPDTPFDHTDLPFCADDALADLYLHASDVFTSLGFEHYEISNFALVNHRCRHNLKYWQSAPYLGLGASAHSFTGSRRYGRTANIRAYIEGANCGHIPLEHEDTGGDAAEWLMLRMRLSDGVTRTELAARGISAQAFESAAAPYVADGLMAVNDGCWRLTPRGYLLSNPIILSLCEVV